MYQCPGCQDTLVEVRGPDGSCYRCPTCRGEASTIFRLRKTIGGVLADSMSRLASLRKERSRLRCPVCEKQMLKVPLAAGEEDFDVEHCRNCAMFWFEAGELDRLPTDHAGEIPHLPNAAQAAREATAMAAVEEIRLKSQAGEPAEGWKHLIGLLGLPVEYGHPSPKQPLTTWILAAICTLLFLITLPVGTSAFWYLGFVPDEPFRYGGLPLVTSFLTHATWGHLLGNMYFLCVFGDNVEERLAPRNYLLMLLAGSLAGTTVHSIITPAGSVPLIGASDSISAILVYYALQFPRERLGFLLWYWWQVHWVSISAIWCLAMWIGYQLLLTGMQMEGWTNVSALAHLGGAVVGAAFWWYHEYRGREEESPQPTRIQTVFK